MGGGMSALLFKWMREETGTYPFYPFMFALTLLVELPHPSILFTRNAFICLEEHQRLQNQSDLSKIKAHFL